ncbi:MAG: hypothetical protein AAGB51_04440 [Planctomycetota bacterium]
MHTLIAWQEAGSVRSAVPVHEGAPVALFGKKKGGGAATEDGDAGATEGGAGSPKGFQPEPAKAEKWFTHARTMHEATNYEYAMQCWLKGLSFNPTDMPALEGFFKSAAGFREDPKAKLSKEIKSAIGGKNDPERWAASLLVWSVKPTDLTLAVKATKLASKCELPEQAYWIGEQALRMAMGDPKAKKETYVDLMKAFIGVEAFDLAVRAGEMGVRLDPNDSGLANDVRDLSARAAMSGGGYDDQREGGFRKNLRDADQQRKLEEADRISKSEGVKDRMVREAEEALMKRPDDLPSIDKMLRALRDRASDEDLKRAQGLAHKTYESTKQFKYREVEGEVRIRRLKKKLGEYRRIAEAKADDPKAQKQYKAAQIQFVEREVEEIRLTVEAYPTDLTRKYELGKRLFMLGGEDNYNEAISMFQESQNDGKLKADSLRYLGLSFSKIGWEDEAIDQLRAALQTHEDETDPQGLELRYALLLALEAQARSKQNLDSAVEAEKLAAGIAMQQLTFKDIRDRRQGLKRLVEELGAT